MMPLPSPSPSLESEPVMPAEGGPEAPAAPSITLPPERAQALKGDHQFMPGDRYTLTVAVRSVGEDGSLTLDVPEDATFTPAGGGELGELGEEASEPVDRFGGPRPLSGVGKSLEE